MSALHLDDDDGDSFIALSDALFNAFFLVACMFVLQALLPHMKAASETRAGVNPGRMCAELFWSDGVDVDVDLWGKGPNGPVVGYTNRSSPMMDLLHDDLGSHRDTSGRSYETMCSRVLAAGEWTFNVHYYAPHDDTPHDVPVTLVLEFPGDNNLGVVAQQSIKVTGVLHGVGDEVTLIDFNLDAHGQVEPDSINTVHQELRSARP